MTKLTVTFHNSANTPNKLMKMVIILHALNSTPEYMMHSHFRKNILGNKPARHADYQKCADF
jgi:hypothetical protein